MLSQALKPIYQRTSVATKLVALIVCMGLPIMVLAQLYMSKTRNEITFTEREILGVDFARSVWPTVFHAALPQGEKTNVMAARAAKTLRDDAAISARPLLLESDSLALSRALEGLAGHKSPLTQSPASVTKAGENLLREVADRSNLILDPELETFYLMDLTMLQLPAFMSSIRQLSDTLTEIHTNPRANHERELVFRIGAFQSALENLRASGKNTADAQTLPALRDEIRGEVDRLVAAGEDILERADRLTRTVDFHSPRQRNALKRSINAANLDSLKFRVFTGADQLWRISQDGLRALLAKRAERLKQDELFGLLFSGAALALAVLLAWLITVSITRPQRRLVEVMNAISGGDVRLTVPYRNFSNEIGQTARAIEFFRGAIIERQMMEADLEMERATLEERVVERTAQFEKARNHAEESARTAALAMEQAIAGVWRLDNATGEFVLSPEWARVTGLTLDEHGRANGSFISRIHADDLAAYLKDVRSALNTGRTDSTVRYAHPDGRMRWLRSLGAVEKETNDFVGMLFDVTAEKEREIELAQARARAEFDQRATKLAISAMQAGVWRVDRQSGAVITSEEFHAIVGSLDSPKAQASGHLWRFVFEEDQPIAMQAIASLKETGATTFDVRICRDDGSVRWTRWPCTIVGDQAFGLVIDITEQKEKDIAISEAREKAEAANRAKSEFLATMSHEIRTPMNGVMAMASALNRTQLLPDQKDMVRIINQSGEMLLAVLNDVLDIAKIESGRMTLDIVEFDLAETMGSVTALYNESASKKGLTLHLKLGEGVGGVYRGDPLRLRQILQNFVSNAIKFSSSGEVLIAVVLEAEHLRFSVRDQGIGMSPEQVARMFQKFSQADSSITRRYGGTGLGLSICREFANLMNGEVGVESREGEGSTFWFRAPFERIGDCTLQTSEDAAPIDEDALPALRILAADDNATNRLVLKVLLQQFGMEADFVENGALALQAAQLREYDLFLMDVHMPEMDGMSATRAIRALDNANARAPIIALTADVLPEHVRICLEAGMNDHVAKPIKPNLLFEAIGRALHAEPREGEPEQEGAESAVA